MVNAQDLDGCVRDFIQDDVWQTGNDKLPRARNSSHATSGGQKFKGIGCVEQSFGNGLSRSVTVSLDVNGNVFKILRGGRRPSHLHRFGPGTISALQRTLDSRPNFGCSDKLTTRCCVPAGSNRGKKATLFSQVAIHSLTRQIIRASAGFVGNAGEFGFLLDA